PHAAEVQRRGGAGHRAGAGGRGRARRPHRHVQLPAHRRGAGGAAQADRPQGHPRERPRGRHLDRERAQVHGPEGRLSPERARGHHAHAPQQAGRATRGAEAGRPRHRAARREGAAAGVLMADRLEPPKKPLGPSTMSVHGGEPRQKPAHALTTPIVQTATYTWANSQELKDYFDGKIDERIDYGRYGNPTQKVAESKLAALEGAADCLLFASGMGAMTTALYALLSRGTHVVITDDSYRRTRQFLNVMLPRYGIEISTVPAGDYEALEDAIKPTTRVLVSESPTNPYNRVLDLERFAAYLLVRGLKTFALRMERQNQSAQTIAEFLAAHPRVERVHYPGLPSHPGHDVAKKQMRGFGGVVSFEVRGDLDAASRVV